MKITSIITRAIKVIFLSVLQEAMKQILEQKSHPWEVHNKSYKVIKSHVFHVTSS